ncbi:hypothetical protein FB451DRAFT_1185110 [Mycena latifolia]|nr:hypothetical protein FB451DRAFT_1185110 [Mycena latifolia]
MAESLDLKNGGRSACGARLDGYVFLTSAVSCAGTSFSLQDASAVVPASSPLQNTQNDWTRELPDFSNVPSHVPLTSSAYSPVARAAASAFADCIFVHLACVPRSTCNPSPSMACHFGLDSASASTSLPASSPAGRDAPHSTTSDDAALDSGGGAMSMSEYLRTLMAPAAQARAVQRLRDAFGPVVANSTPWRAACAAQEATAYLNTPPTPPHTRARGTKTTGGGGELEEEYNDEYEDDSELHLDREEEDEMEDEQALAAALETSWRWGTGRAGGYWTARGWRQWTCTTICALGALMAAIIPSRRRPPLPGADDAPAAHPGVPAPLPPTYVLAEAAHNAHIRQMPAVLLPAFRNVVWHVVVEYSLDAAEAPSAVPGARRVGPLDPAARMGLADVVREVREEEGVWFDGVDWRERENLFPLDGLSEKIRNWRYSKRPWRVDGLIEQIGTHMPTVGRCPGNKRQRLPDAVTLAPGPFNLGKGFSADPKGKTKFASDPGAPCLKILEWAETADCTSTLQGARCKEEQPSRGFRDLEAAASSAPPLMVLTAAGYGNVVLARQPMQTAGSIGFHVGWDPLLVVANMSRAVMGCAMFPTPFILPAQQVWTYFIFRLEFTLSSLFEATPRTCRAFSYGTGTITGTCASRMQLL